MICNMILYLRNIILNNMFVANNFIFKLIHSYFAATIKYNKSYYIKDMKSYLFSPLS